MPAPRLPAPGVLCLYKQFAAHRNDQPSHWPRAHILWKTSINSSHCSVQKARYRFLQGSLLLGRHCGGCCRPNRIDGSLIWFFSFTIMTYSSASCLTVPKGETRPKANPEQYRQIPRRSGIPFHSYFTPLLEANSFRHWASFWPRRAAQATHMQLISGRKPRVVAAAPFRKKSILERVNHACLPY